MFGTAPAERIAIELDALTRLLAATHLHECADWGEAEKKACQDIQSCRREAQSNRPHTVAVLPQVLAHLLAAAKNAMWNPQAGDAPWSWQLAADVAEFERACRQAPEGLNARQPVAVRKKSR